jgi:hypothetical protein
MNGDTSERTMSSISVLYCDSIAVTNFIGSPMNKNALMQAAYKSNPKRTRLGDPVINLPETLGSVTIFGRGTI